MNAPLSIPARFLLSVRSVCCLVLICLSNVGCGPRSMPSSSIEKSQSIFDDATSKYAAGDFVGAKTAAADAIASGALMADQASEASLILIESAIESGDLSAAEVELANAEKTAMDMARVLVLKGRLARKQGNEAAAQEAFNQARAEDPNVVIPQ